MKAPDFELPAPDGKSVRLSDLYKKGPVVVYFYPKNETTGCTAEACAFRDSYEDFKAAGAEVIGISGDSGASHEKFAQHHRLPFILLTDKHGAVAREFGVKKSLLVIPGRETFVIAQGGEIVHHFVSLTKATQHVAEALAVLKKRASQHAVA